MSADPSVPAPALTAARITDDLTRPALNLPPLAWWGAFLTAGGLAGLLLISVAFYCIEGYGIFGPNNSVNWGNDIASYIFWIAVAVAGTLVSSILLLFRQRWRNAVNRSTEAMTVFAINIAGIYPLIHTGRPWVDYWLIPLPWDGLGLAPQFKSPIMWDVFAISGYATASVLFFYLGLLPDLASLRDRARTRVQRLIYGALCMGWRGTASDWRHYERAYTQFAWIATPLVIGMHSTIATLLAVSHVPGWHATIFPPYFVSGAIFGGLAMAFVILVPLRRTLALEHYITADHLDKLAKIMLTVGLIVCYVYLVELFTAWYSENEAERAQYLYRLTGQHAWAFWLMIFCNVVVVQALWSRRVRRSAAALFAIGLLVNVGMWFERYNIVVQSLEHDHLPSRWTSYAFTAWDYLLLAGSFGLFFSQFLIFARVAPVVAIAEIKTVLLRRAPAPVAKEGA
jgi:molybdopterin-containing oxidoreductase family membrane subunit